MRIRKRWEPELRDRVKVRKFIGLLPLNNIVPEFQLFYCGAGESGIGVAKLSSFRA